MLLQLKDTGSLVEVIKIEELIDPNIDVIHGKDQEGQEEQDPEPIKKENLVFPSGESIPRCWVDANYQKA